MFLIFPIYTMIDPLLSIYIIILNQMFDHNHQILILIQYTLFFLQVFINLCYSLELPGIIKVPISP